MAKDLKEKDAVLLVMGNKRKNLPSSRVSVKNNSEKTRHVIIDRLLNGHTLMPGQQVDDIELIDEDIRSFQKHPDIAIIGVQVPAEEQRQRAK